MEILTQQVESPATDCPETTSNNVVATEPTRTDAKQQSMDLPSVSIADKISHLGALNYSYKTSRTSIVITSASVPKLAHHTTITVSEREASSYVWQTPSLAEIRLPVTPQKPGRRENGDNLNADSSNSEQRAQCLRASEFGVLGSPAVDPVASPGHGLEMARQHYEKADAPWPCIDKGATSSPVAVSPVESLSHVMAQ